MRMRIPSALLMARREVPPLLPARAEGVRRCGLGVALAPPDAAGVVRTRGAGAGLEGAAEAAVVVPPGQSKRRRPGRSRLPASERWRWVGAGGGVAVLLAPQAASRAVAAPAVAIWKMRRRESWVAWLARSCASLLTDPIRDNR